MNGSLIPLHVIEKSFGTSFKFHSDMLNKSNKTKFFTSFYSKTFLNGKKHLAMMTEIPSCNLSRYLWYNESIQVDKASVHFLEFSENSINHVSQHFSDSRPSKNGMNLRERVQPT